MKRTAVALFVATLVLSPSAAGAISSLRSYSGADYSANSETGKYVYACDMESDSHSVKAEYQRTGSGSTYSVTNGGGASTCASVTLSTVVYKHRIVEIVPYGLDDKGSWVYPS